MSAARPKSPTTMTARDARGLNKCEPVECCDKHIEGWLKLVAGHLLDPDLSIHRNTKSAVFHDYYVEPTDMIGPSLWAPKFDYDYDEIKGSHGNTPDRGIALGLAVPRRVFRPPFGAGVLYHGVALADSSVLDKNGRIREGPCQSSQYECAPKGGSACAYACEYLSDAIRHASPIQVPTCTHVAHYRAILVCRARNARDAASASPYVACDELCAYKLLLVGV
jgi:hypothetical protein